MFICRRLPIKRTVMSQALLVDIGNSAVRIVRWQGSPSGGTEDSGRITRVHQQETPHSPAGRKRLAYRLSVLATQAGNIPVVLVSVVPVLDTAILEVMPDVLRIDHTWSLPFGLAISDPAAVGADRYCNMAAAVRAGWQDALVVDAGTATTFDLLREGTFCGGLIAPGMAFAARQLGKTAARLQAVEFVAAPLAIGTDTDSALRGGSFHVGRYGIIGTIEALLEVYGSCPVVLTGGLGHYLQRAGWLCDPEWTLRGAAHLLSRRLERQSPDGADSSASSDLS
jgi:type III pantothenate kinase